MKQLRVWYDHVRACWMQESPEGPKPLDPKSVRYRDIKLTINGVEMTGLKDISFRDAKRTA